MKKLLFIPALVALVAAALAVPYAAYIDAQQPVACELKPEQWGPGHCRVVGAATWDQIGAQFNLPSTGSGTDGTSSTRGDRVQAANGVGVSTSDTSQAGAERVLHVPLSPPPPASTTTSSSSTTTSTSSSTTSTSLPTTTSSSTTSTTAPTTTSTSTSTTLPATTTTAVSTTTTTPPSGAFNVDFDTPADFYGADLQLGTADDAFQSEVFFGIDQPRGSHTDWIGDHDMSCGGEPTNRNVHHASAGDDPHLFWWCAPGGPDTGHLMTSVQTEGYAQVLFAPNRTFTNVKKICWDQSMKSLPRKWTQVVVIPETMYQANNRVLHYVSPEVLPFPAIDGIPPGPMTDGPNGDHVDHPALYAQWDSYVLTFTNGSIDQHSRQGRQMYFNAIGSATGAPRYRQCLTDNENGTITHVNEMPPSWFSDSKTTRAPITLPGSLPNGPVRVIFEDDIYDSFKTDAGDPTNQKLGTWHWDNIEIS